MKEIGVKMKNRFLSSFWVPAFAGMTEVFFDIGQRR